MDLSNISDPDVIKEITSVICKKTQNEDEKFFKIEVAYYLAKMAACMRTVICTPDRGEVPVNLYAIALGESGAGKNMSINIIEKSFLSSFKHKFCYTTMPEIAEHNLSDIAINKAVNDGIDEGTALDQVKKEYERLGVYQFTFDSGTAPGVKQMRDRLLMAGCGSINLQIDEIGSNLIGNTEILNLFLELYDQGLVKSKLIKNTVDNVRIESRDGRTPANMFLFGTPSKLMDGGLIEEEFMSFLDTGYARRCLFGFIKTHKNAYLNKTAEEIYAQRTDANNNIFIDKWQTHFAKLAGKDHYNWKLTMSKEVAILLIKYQQECIEKADKLPLFEECRRAEMTHRFFKALKLAGAIAFSKEALDIDETTLLQAIKIVEESGQAFDRILHKVPPYVKLANYIVDYDKEICLTQTELLNLPFFKGKKTDREDLLDLAMDYAYTHDMIIKKIPYEHNSNRFFYTGSRQEKTDLNKIIFSYSDHVAYNYSNEEQPFNKLETLLKAYVETDNGLHLPMHWCNHHFSDHHRHNDSVEPRFNLLVLDIDGGLQLNTVHELLKNYTFITHTTKRHTPEDNRFRLLLPISHVLSLNNDEYKEYMNNVFHWLPFKASEAKNDESSNQPCKKWLTNENGIFTLNEGILLDGLQFIPNTNRSVRLQESITKFNLDNLENWFARKMVKGDRNNLMYRYAIAIANTGISYDELEHKVYNLNKNITQPLSKDELQTTVLTSIAKWYKEHDRN